MLEKDNIAKVRAWCDKNGMYAIKHYGGPFSAVGFPDLIINYRSRAIYVEVKATGKEPKPSQEIIMNKLKEYGMWTNWFDDYKEAIKWLKEVKSSIDQEYY